VVAAVATAASVVAVMPASVVAALAVGILLAELRARTASPDPVSR
jgi:hypothetical protein